MWRPSSPALTGVRGARLISVEQVPSCLISSSSLSLLWGRGGGSGKAAAAFAVVPACSLSGTSTWCRGKHPRGYSRRAWWLP